MSTVTRLAAGFERNKNWQILSIDEIRKNWKDDVNHLLGPQAGDYVFYSNTSGIDRTYSGIVKSVSGRNLITIEGNVSDRVKQMTREDWRTLSVGNTVVNGIGYRRLVSRSDFSPRTIYGVIDQDMTVDFILVHVQ